MSDLSNPITRKIFLRRAAASGSILTVPGLLAACGGGKVAPSGGGSTVAAKLPKTITFSNWPLYIDVGKNKNHPSLQQFEAAHPGTHVTYLEDINDNNSFFGKIEGPLSQGQSTGRDLVVMTDSSGLPQRMVQLGWLEKWDKSAMPHAFKNLVPAQQHPAWDPHRDFSLPWQSGMTGIGFDPKKVGYNIDSVDQLLTDKKLRGKVTLLTELSDTMGLVMLSNGDDPAHVTNATWSKAVSKIKAAVNSGQIRQFTGNDYAAGLANGDIWACFAWSGDMVQLQADHPGLKWNPPATGAMIWTDNMLIPKGGNVYGASVLADWFYIPKIAAEVEDYVNYICPVVGADKILLKSDPAVGKNPLIFPPASLLAKTHEFDSKALNNATYKQQFQNLIGA